MRLKKTMKCESVPATGFIVNFNYEVQSCQDARMIGPGRVSFKPRFFNIETGQIEPGRREQTDRWKFYGDLEEAKAEAQFAILERRANLLQQLGQLEQTDARNRDYVYRP